MIHEKIGYDDELNGQESHWNLLENYVTQYDSKENNYMYHYLVADKILSTDSQIKLPSWLLSLRVTLFSFKNYVINSIGKKSIFIITSIFKLWII